MWTRGLAVRLSGAMILATSAVLGAVLSAPSLANRSSSQPRNDANLSKLARLVEMPIPYRNLYRLTDQLKLRSARSIAHVVNKSSPNYPTGHQDNFLVLSEDANKYFTIRATIRAETPHLYLYIQNGVSVSESAVQKVAQHFEKSIYPTDRAYFGSEWTPGVDDDPHITCLVGNLQSSGIAGYFSAEDEYPRLVNPYSNQREMIYLNSAATLPGDPSFDQTLSHEFQHMIHFHTHPHDNGWLNEGMSMLAEYFNHYPPSSEPNSYVSLPDTQLNSWSENDDRVGAHYGGAYLYLSYLYDRFGRGLIKDLVADKNYTDFELVNDVFRKDHVHETADQIFTQWVVANIVNDHSIAGGVYGYKHLKYQVQPQKQGSIPSPVTDTVPPYGAQYVVYDNLSGQKSFQLHFSGAPTVAVVSAPHAAPYWWGNKGDLSDPRLVRTVDLTHVRHASLHFQLWFDIEKDYDYGYVEASRDGGVGWTTLRGRYSTLANPNGASYGYAYTGSSHGWHSELMDLTPYAGHKIMLRFEYITDDVYTGQGYVVKNINIPEIGFQDNLSGWTQQGFVPVTANALRSDWIVQLIEYTSQGVVVKRFPLAGNLQGSLTVDPGASGLQKLVVSVFNAVPKTTNQATWQLTSN